MSRKQRVTKTGSETSIQNGYLYFEDVRQCAVDSEAFREMLDEPYIKSIRVQSLSSVWQVAEWVTATDRVVDTINVEMTLRKETRSFRGYWYAYRRVFGKLEKKFVGQAGVITEAKLLEIARKLPTTF